jgi:YidC/Oxa1 family membrane protein insertase
MMDKKTTIGMVLIGVILAIWVFTSGPSKEQKEAQKRAADSIALATELAEKKARETQKAIAAADTAKKTVVALTDSARDVIQKNKWLDFYPASKGTEESVVIENDKIKAFISTKSGRITNVILKEFKRSDKTTPVELFEKDKSKQSVIINAYNDKIVFLDSLYFTPDKKEVKVTGDNTGSLKMTLSTARPGSYIEYVYSLKGNDYMVDYKMNFVKMDSILTPGAPVEIDWEMSYPSQEKHIEKERQISTVYYCDSKESVDNLSQGRIDSVTKAEKEIKWVAFKQQFFSAALINNDMFAAGKNFFWIKSLEPEDRAATHQDSLYVKEAKAKLLLPDPIAKSSYSLKYYFGPNHYQTLNNYDLNLEDMIPMGWSFFSYINKLLVVPVFTLFDGSGFGFGWVIMILTLVIKGLLFPIGYMTYKSSMKMKMLKPETDAITEKYGKDGDPMKKQQETMALYGRAGVSPFSGCLPLVFQMFVLIALFNFFPAAFELRQKGFLWADDLSTYDSVLDFGFNIPLYGDHVSMFALLMFVSTLGFTFYQQKMFPNQQGNMPGMKFMMYVMPFIFLGFMNSYSAGLSWYYFIANVINILQNLVLRRFVDENKIRAEIEKNLKNPAKKKKGGFAARLEEMSKQRQQQMRKK